MRMLKYFLPFIAMATLSSGYAAVTYMPEDYDVHALKQVEQNKSVVNVLSKGNNLFISGDVRANWRRLERHTAQGGAYSTGSGSGKPDNIFESIVNLLVDYDADCAWAQVKLNFTNLMGNENGTDNSIVLERAFVGYDFLHCGDSDMYLEAGRQKMDYLFESEVMFNSTFDGLLLGYDYSWEEAGDFFIHGGPFVINENYNHYGWVVEVGAMEIAETGLYAKYSFTDWRKKGVTGNVDGVGVVDSPAFRFEISHFVLGYVFDPDLFRFPARIYAAGLVNHSAKSVTASGGKKHNWGWYAGVELGKLEVAGDWALNVNYQWVGFQSMPSTDVAGIGRGYTDLIDSQWLGNPMQAGATGNPAGATATPDTQDPANLQGNTNYKGVEATAFYNVTSNLALRACFKASNPVTKTIGGSHKYRDYELGVIYSF